MSDRRSNLLVKSVLIASGIGLAIVALRNRARILESIRYACDYRNPLRHKHIEIIETPDDCQRVVEILKKHLDKYKVLGFDCEWVTVGGTRRPLALLQLSSHEGLCALFRLCSMKHIPKSLRDLLEDDDIIKVGVAPHDDAKKLAHDYGVGVASTFDLRFLSVMTGHGTEGLAKLAKKHLNVHLDKNWRLVCSDWEANHLTEKQMHYAANDALVAVEIFRKLSKELVPKKFLSRRNEFATTSILLEPFYDVAFKEGYQITTFPLEKKRRIQNALSILSAKNRPSQQQSRSISTRSKILYDNCLLEAPDGELLCTIDRRRAKWYMDQNLGVEVNKEPFTVRLNFEPAGRPVGEVGRYYQTLKENQCVVCGKRDGYIRKNVVPREYRKHFPVVMKSHTSHDVLLLCPNCHQLSNISDHHIRIQLAKKCEAPILQGDGAAKSIELPVLKQIRSAARALLHNGYKIPIKRRIELEKLILEHFKDETCVTLDLLERTVNIETTYNNETYCQHGAKVVTKYQTDFGGLIELEKLWREHFLRTMKPQYLPALWNVNHNANRLEIRANEGRVDAADLKLAGLEPSIAANVELGGVNAVDLELVGMEASIAADVEPKSQPL